MFLTHSTDHPNKSYKNVISDVLNNGSKVAPRGIATIEIQPYIHEVLHPEKKLCSVPGRRSNPFFNMAENCWILAGKGDSEWVCSFNAKLKEYQLDEGQTDFNAPYGRRIRFANKYHKPIISLNKYNTENITHLPQVDQLYHCYCSLKKDPFSRQAVVSLWNPLFDYHENNTKDRPCNTTIYFKIREEKLCMTVCNRSNDLHLGLYGVNFIQFAHIQEFMAAALNVGIGHYVHFSDSLHIYESSEHTKNILMSDYNFDIYEHCNPYILTYDEVSIAKQDKETKDVNLGDFLIIADQVISESKNFRESEKIEFFAKDFKFCETNYSRACAMYLIAYDFYKKKNYNVSIQLLEQVFARGFKDWAVLGLEFIMRNAAVSEYSEGIENFICETFEAKSAQAVLKYIHAH